MADKVTIKLKGADKAVKDMHAYYKKKKPKVEDVIKQTVITIASDAKPNAPKKWNVLRASLTASWTRGPDRSSKKGVRPPATKSGRFTGVSGTNVRYAHMQEFGTWGDAKYPDDGESPPKRDHEPWARPSEGFLFLTKSYEQHKNDPERKIKAIFRK